MSDDQVDQKVAPLFNGAFLGLCLVNFLAFCNLTIFYGFYDHLAGLGVPEAWRGTLLALEPFTAFVLRPVLSPLFTVRNGVRCLALGLGLVTLALLAYPLARTVPPLFVVRILHGAGFVVLVSAEIGLLVHVVPRERSGQGFGIFTLTTLIPYAAMPPFAEHILPLLADKAQIYALAAPLMLPAFAFLPLLARRMRLLAATLGAQGIARPRWSDIRANFKTPGILSLLAASLGLFTATCAVFFFAKPAAQAVGLANPGLFFTVSTLVNIALRAGANAAFDRIDKTLALVSALALLVAVFSALAWTGSPEGFLILAGLYGLGLGLAMPMLNALVVLISPAHLKSLNANLQLFAMDAGFFLGPLAAGLVAPWGVDRVFLLAAALVLAACLLVILAIPCLRKASERH